MKNDSVKEERSFKKIAVKIPIKYQEIPRNLLQKY